MDAKLRQERIDGPYLDSAPPAPVAEFGGIDVVPTRRHDQRQGAELF